MEQQKTFVKPRCKLVGTDGNVFALAGRVGSALKRAGYRDEANEFYGRLTNCASYDDALCLMLEYVDEGDEEED